MKSQRPQLPLPDDDASAHSAQLSRHLQEQIQAAGGWLSFAAFMEELLYAPALGYYVAGARKFGASGDFITAPEMTPLFGASLAQALAPMMAALPPHLLELGAGTGQLAIDLLSAMETLGHLPESYQILELSPDLRARQQARISAAMPHLAHRVSWLDALPERFSGVVLGNEVLDAMPAHLVRWDQGEIFERGVIATPEGFGWALRPAEGALRTTAACLASDCDLLDDYESEVSLLNRAWAKEWGRRLETGAVLLLDYGFPRREYYHPDRNQGTLMCHYRHHAHPDPFVWPGLQDVTVHVDFTAIIEAGHAEGLELLGYLPQSQFLINCGILDLLATLDPGSKPYIRASQAVGKLLMPHEMGELFKVIAMGKNLPSTLDPLPGFQHGDQSHRL